MVKRLIYFISVWCFMSCSTDDTPTVTTYFPPIDSEEWDLIGIDSLGWNEAALDKLYNYLEDNNTRAFIILKNGKIAVEKYWGNTINGSLEFTKNSNWYWASAGKTITASLVGIVQEEGFLNIQDKTSDYLGVGWTSLTTDQEDSIKIIHQLSMTTGLNFNDNNLNCTLPECLTFSANAGEQWYYHNAPYTLLQDVISNATQMDYNTYTNLRIESKIGMNGQWISNGFNTIYWSTARDMARFGLLVANKGKWKNTDVIGNSDYVEQMTSTSQNLNPSYGYLWWLNGQSSIILPGIANPLDIPLSTNAPEDLIAGMGKNGQYVEIVPDLNLVIIRMGEAPGESLVNISFHEEMWDRLSNVIN